MSAALSLGGCKAATSEEPLDNNPNQEKPDSTTEAGQKASALSSRVYLEVKSITPIAMTDEMLTLRVSYSFNQGLIRNQQMMIPIKKGEAKSIDLSNWISGSPKPDVVALVFRSRTVYNAGDMFGFAFEVTKPFDGSQDLTAQSLMKAFISEASGRPSIQMVKTNFEFPAKSQLRVWLNE